MDNENKPLMQCISQADIDKYTKFASVLKTDSSLEDRFNSPEYQKYANQMVNKKMAESIKFPDYSKFESPIQKTNKLLGEQNNKIDELQKSLNDSQVINEYQAEQLKQLNDKVAEAKYLQKVAESKLQEERDKSDSVHKSDRRLQIIIAVIGMLCSLASVWLGWWLGVN